MSPFALQDKRWSLFQHEVLATSTVLGTTPLTQTVHALESSLTLLAQIRGTDPLNPVCRYCGPQERQFMNSLGFCFH